MQDTLGEIERRLQVMRTDDGDPAEGDVHHWQDINPVVCEPLLQLSMGTPGVIYHGGLCHARLRHFDPVGERPGLPEKVAALVSRVTADQLDLELVNLDAAGTREIVVQAGVFGEHLFTAVTTLEARPRTLFEGDKGTASFRAVLEPSSRLALRLSMRLFARTPSYAFPWHAP